MDYDIGFVRRRRIISANESYFAVPAATSGAFTPTSAESSSYLARTSGLDIPHKTALDALITGLVTDGVWAVLDAIWITANQDATNALLNLKSTNYTLVSHGSPTFTADRGFTGVDSSTTIWLDTQFNLSTNGVNFLQSNAHNSAWCVNNVASGVSGGHMFSNYDGVSSTAIIPRANGDVNFSTTNSGGIPGVASVDSTGHWISDRSSGSQTQIYRNGSSAGWTAGTDTSVARLNLNMFLCALNNSGSTTNGSAGQIAMASLGGSLLGSSLYLSFYNRLRTYMTAVGVP